MKKEKKRVAVKILAAVLSVTVVIGIIATFFLSTKASYQQFCGYDMVAVSLKYLDDSKYKYKDTAVNVPAQPEQNIYDCSSWVNRVLLDAAGVSSYYGSGLPGYSGAWRDTYFSGKSVGDVVTILDQKFKITVMPGTSYTSADLPVGTIMIYATADGTTKHMAISLGVQNSSTIINDLYETYRGSVGISDAELARLLNATCNNGAAKVLQTTNCEVWRIHASNAQKDICIDNGTCGGSQGEATLSYALAPVEGSNSLTGGSNSSNKVTAAPVIESLKVTDKTNEGYTVNVTFTAEAGVRKVLMPTWTDKDGQDDLIWHEAKISGNTASYHVNISDHNNETGTYITHVYVYDRNDKFTVEGVNVTIEKTAVAAAPKILDVKVSEVTQAGYRVTVTFEAAAGVQSVFMPTWTEKGGQDDIIWHTAEVSGNTASYYISANGHNGESGKYITHVYVYDYNDQFALGEARATLPTATQEAPTIESVKITEQSLSGYRVTVKFNAPAGLNKVYMPTWTNKNGQDDIIWYEASVSGNTANYYVSVDKHNNQNGIYITHVYVYDVNGAFALEGIKAVISSITVEPSIQNVQVSEESANGYRVTITFNAPAGVDEVYMPTWTEKNGQDDLIHHKAKISGNTASFYIRRSDHNNEYGNYITHIYVYDVNGTYAIAEAKVKLQ
ncbi:MAG: GBS Bsp-like repeat-containing protein [Lachnospiraceae bacterium]